MRLINSCLVAMSLIVTAFGAGAADLVYLPTLTIDGAKTVAAAALRSAHEHAAPGDEALDGMKVDVQGDLYVTAPDGVRIYSAAGKHLGTVAAPRTVHNLAWGGEDGHTLYLCATDRLYRIDVLVPGSQP